MKPMRHKYRLLNHSNITKDLHVGISSILAIFSVDESPYTVPHSYVYNDDCNHIYIHGANEGHKLDSIKYHVKASFCIVNKDEPIIKQLDTMFRSIIALARFVLSMMKVKNAMH